MAELREEAAHALSQARRLQPSLSIEWVEKYHQIVNAHDDENGEIVVPDCVRVALRPLVGQIDALDEAIGAIDKEIAASVKADETVIRRGVPTPIGARNL